MHVMREKAFTEIQFETSTKRSPWSKIWHTHNVQKPLDTPVLGTWHAYLWFRLVYPDDCRQLFDTLQNQPVGVFVQTH